MPDEVPPPASDDPMDVLTHVLDMYSDAKGDDYVIETSYNHYAPGLTTGLTWDDLRELHSRLSFVEKHLQPDWGAQQR